MTQIYEMYEDKYTEIMLKIRRYVFKHNDAS